jgi:alanyl-tRNA synthetase
MQLKQLKQLYFQFFQERGHTIIPSASIVPVNDPTILFTPAGMQPLTPNLMGEPHQGGTRLVDSQKCIRTADIDDVGDDSHLTFFEMLGNWSLGDYFKTESIQWSYEFLTSAKYLNIPNEKLSVTCFAGEGNIPKDTESAELWQKVGIPTERIYFLGKDDNFWGPVGSTGPCGPDTEIFYDTGKPKCGDDCKPGCKCGKFLEIWNNVFMEFNRTANGEYEPLKQKNVDTGMGVERTVAVLNGYGSVFQIEYLAEMLELIRQKSSKPEVKSLRIIADHIKAATFMLADDAGLEPSNTDQGYVLRRLIRRAIRHARMIGYDPKEFSSLVQLVNRQYHTDYPELSRNANRVLEQLTKETEKFLKTLDNGLKEFERISVGSQAISGKDAFDLYQSYGFPIEVTEELAASKGLTVDRTTFETELAAHQDLSRTASAGKFKGGLADHSEQSTKYHTANHIMLEAMRRILGPHVEQRGSNITQERLRFDFSHPDKLTPEQIKQIEDIANEQIARNLEVHYEEMTVPEAKALGATGVFEHKYGDKVKVYFVGDFSKEICGGPHVENTKGMGKLKITKEEASSAGVRRVKAVLE